MSKSPRQAGYYILVDYGSEGHNFYNDTPYETVADAVKAALKLGIGFPVEIVKVVEVKAVFSD